VSESTTAVASPAATSSLDELCINTIRTLSMDGVQKAETPRLAAA